MHTGGRRGTTITITLELTPDEEALVRRTAALRGEDVPALIRTLTLAGLNAPTGATATRTTGFDTASAREKRTDLARMGAEAAEEARAALHAKGAPVYSLEGETLVQELPDGTNRPVRVLRSQE